MKIAAIDQSYTHAGFCVFDTVSMEVLETADTEYHKKATRKQKRALMAEKVMYLMDFWDIEAIVMEEPRRFPSIKTMVALFAMTYHIVDTIDLPVYVVNTTTHHKAFTGNGKCDKQAVIDAAFSRYMMRVDDDVADAISIAYAYSVGVKHAEVL